MDNSFIYITRSGRTVKRLYTNLNLSARKRTKKIHMMVHSPPRRQSTSGEQSGSDKDNAQGAIQQQQRQELENMRMALLREKQEFEAMRQQSIADLERQRASLQTISLQIEMQRREMEVQICQRSQLAQPTQPDSPLAQAPQADPPSVQTRPVAAAQAPTSANSTITDLVEAIGNVNFVNNEIKLPKFADENSGNPLEFLYNIEKYFALKNTREENKMSVIEVALQNKARWWLDLQGPFFNYQTFKIKFTAEFFSIPVQVKIENKWANRRYSKDNDGNLQNYFYKQLKEVNFILPYATVFKKNYTIIQQFPRYVRETLASIDLENTSMIGQILAQLDSINGEGQRDRERRPFQNPSWNNNTHEARVRNVNIYRGRYNSNRHRDSQRVYYNPTYNRRNEYVNNRPYYDSRHSWRNIDRSNNQQANANNSRPQDIRQLRK